MPRSLAWSMAWTLAAVAGYTYQGNDVDLHCLSIKGQHRLDGLPVHDPGKLQWQDSELKVWLRGTAFMLREGRGGRLLDVGCGLGRISLRFGHLFRETTCLEADADRARGARLNIQTCASDEHRDTRFTFANKQFLAFAGSADHESPGFDAITCMHVAQHIAYGEPRRWVRRFFKLAAPGGLVLMATTLWTSQLELTVEGQPIRNNQKRTTPRLIEEFDAIVNGSRLGEPP